VRLTKVFVDTEFTDLWSPELISIGLAAEGGESLYIEIAPDPAGATGWAPSACSRFVQQVVIPMLEGGRVACSRSEASGRILAWLESIPGGIELVSDSAVDFHLLHELWEPGMPSNLCAEHVERATRESKRQCQSTREGLRRHHALDDAIALRREKQGPARAALET
jgi:hypothetical protein